MRKRLGIVLQAVFFIEKKCFHLLYFQVFLALVFLKERALCARFRFSTEPHELADCNVGRDGGVALARALGKNSTLLSLKLRSDVYFCSVFIDDCFDLLSF